MCRRVITIPVYFKPAPPRQGVRRCGIATAAERSVPVALAAVTGYIQAMTSPNARCFAREMTGAMGPAFNPMIPVPRIGLRKSQIPKICWMTM